MFSLSLLGLLLIAIAPATFAASLSPNIPLDDPVYSYLNKLDGLGYLSMVQVGTKPYTRMQVAGWIQGIREHLPSEALVPDYVQRLLERLEKEFAPELAVSEQADIGKTRLTVGYGSLRSTYYDGKPLVQHQTSSVYHPLTINNNGYSLDDGINLFGTLGVEGELGRNLVFGLEPFFSSSEEEAKLSITSGYLKTRVHNIQVQLGKDPVWWGQGERGSLLLTNNSRPLTALAFSTLEPLEFNGFLGWLGWLGPLHFNFFYSELESNRTDVPQPSFGGSRVTVSPSEHLTIGAAFASIVGGEGRHLNSGDYRDFIIGKNATTATEDKWNSLAGIDFRWRIPGRYGVQVYGEMYGEDQAGKIIPWPSHNSFLFGIYLPRLTADGRWEMVVEGAQTIWCSYSHWVYREGWVYHGNLMGDAMGNNANRYYLRVTRYFDDSTRLNLHAEHLVMDRDEPYPQTVTGFWADYERDLRTDLRLTLSAGYADIRHVNFSAELSDQQLLLSVGMRFKE